MNAFRLSPDGKTVVAAESDEIRGFELATGRVIFRHKYPGGVSTSAGRVTDGNTLTLIVTHNAGNRIEFRRYALGSGKNLSHTGPLGAESFDQSAFTRDGRLAAIFQRETLKVFETATGKELWQEAVAQENIGGLAFTADGTRLVMATRDELRVFDIVIHKVVRTHRLGNDKGELNPGRGRSRLAEPVWSPKGEWIACPAGEDGDLVLVWGPKDEVPRHSFKAEKPIAFTADEKELVSYHQGRAAFHELSTGKTLREVDVITDDDLALTPDGKAFVASAGDCIVVTDAATGKLLPQSADPPGLPDDLAFAGPRLLGKLDEWRGWVEWEVATGKQRLLRPPEVHGSVPQGLSSDRRVALYRRERTAEVRDLSTGKLLRSHEFGDEEVSLTGDGKAVVGFTGDAVVLLDVVSGVVRSIDRPGPAGATRDRMACSSDGRWAAMLSADANDHGAVDLYDLPAAKAVRHWTFPGPVREAKFSRTGRLLVVTHEVDGARFNQRGVFTIYDTATGRPVLKAPPDDNVSAAVALSDDDRLLARLEANKKVAIWEVRGGGVRTRLTGPGTVTGLAFSPDGRSLASAGSGGPVLIWPLFEPVKDGPPAVGDLDRAWATLAGKADDAFEAIRRLASYPAESLPYLKGKIQPVRTPDPAVVEKLIAGLDHREYRKREAATAQLARLGECCRGSLEKALAGSPSPECRERLEKLLADEEAVGPALLAAFRAVEVAEYAGPAGVDVLRYWAGGADGAALTREAAGALRRVEESKK
ncbi:MAG TPA: WD40 repeat domain-containing protein [Gemmataceae bacterium]|nr:WD40 repeat domain-containing protein [Gemmataceae bacterium]